MKEAVKVIVITVLILIILSYLGHLLSGVNFFSLLESSFVGGLIGFIISVIYILLKKQG